MKKFSRLILFTLAISGMMLQSGCYGSFALTNKLYDWNGTLGDKFVKSLVFWGLCIIPVYEVAALVDVVIFNLIEFWSGSNPVSMKEGEHEEQLVQYHGKTFKMEASKNRFSITEMRGNKSLKKVNLVFTPENYTWNLEKDQQLIAISRFEKDAEGEVFLRIFTKDGASVLRSFERHANWTAFAGSIGGQVELTAQR